MLRVAIIGAGPCGLACAIELERRGICPDIFERGSRVGMAAPKAGVLLQMFDRPHRDQLRYLERRFGIRIKPLSRLRRVKMHSPRKTVTVEGDLGYLVERGQSRDSVEVQLSERIKSKIQFNIHADYRDLAGRYDFVVVADGSVAAAREMKIYDTVISAWVRAAVILGKYDPESGRIFYNREYARHGYAYMVPFSRERAMILLSVPDIGQKDLDKYWGRLLEKERLNPEIIEMFEMNHISGITSRQKVGNILLVGNSGGFTDSFIGLGLVWGMASGVMAGRAIAGGLDYERLVRPFTGQVRRLLAFREGLNKLDNAGLDRLIGAIGLPGIKNIIYNTNINIVGLLHPFLKKYAV